jgi:hypothetical protein
LRELGLDGGAVARFVVDETGGVDVSSFGAVLATDPLFASAVRDVVGRWRFTPAESNGTPVKQIVQMRVRFTASRP